MTITEIKERYKNELEQIKAAHQFNDKELEIYLLGYVAGTDIILEQIKSNK